MSYRTEEFQIDSLPVVCPSFSKSHDPEYHLTKCSHPGCMIYMCGHCAILCGSCGVNRCCEDHLWHTTLNGYLRKAINVCDPCRKAASEDNGVATA